MKDSARTLVFALALGVGSAGLLAGVRHLTAPFQKANEQAEEVRNILAALRVPHDPAAGSADLLQVFKDNVNALERQGLTLYRYGPPDDPRGIAMPFSGPGLWGPIEGFLALEPDQRTIRGVTFHRQEETPGLGGEIGSEWFQKQFVGKTIVGPEGRPGIVIRPRGGPDASNAVDAITGATMTSERVEAMLNAAIARIVGQEGPDVR